MTIQRLTAAVVLLMVPTASMAQDVRTPRLPLTAAETRKVIASLPEQNTAPPRKTPVGRQVAGGVLGGVGGFFGGAFLGAKIERSIHDCNCDDPGFKGFLIGAPIGAIVGAIAGVKLASR
jgi:hypothetical protein